MKTVLFAAIITLLPLTALAADRPIQTPAEAAVAAKHAAEAAKQAGEPSFGAILTHLGYDAEESQPEISAQLFVKAPGSKVTYKPIAAFGLVKVLSAGWYRPAAARPDLRMLWQVGEKNNKQFEPPIVPGGTPEFDPGDGPFGVYVATAGFPGETVCTEDSLQRFVPRFKATDRHKAHVYPARKDGKIIPNSYIIGWEYSTNNDNQDIVTLISGVVPAPAGTPAVP